MSSMFNPMPQPQFKITGSRSTHRNFTVRSIICNFWACSCRPIHERMLLCSVLQVYMSTYKTKSLV